MVERIDPARLGLGVLIDEQFHAALARHPVAQFVHRLELPRRVDMEQRERRWRGKEGLAREMEHHSAVLADAVQHHGPRGIGHHFRSEEHTSELQSLMRISYAVFCLTKNNTHNL